MPGIFIGFRYNRDVNIYEIVRVMPASVVTIAFMNVNSIRIKYLKAQMLMPTYEKWYLCTVCHELISNLELEKHILTHSGENLINASIVGSHFQ